MILKPIHILSPLNMHSGRGAYPSYLRVKAVTMKPYQQKRGKKETEKILPAFHRETFR